MSVNAIASWPLSSLCTGNITFHVTLGVHPLAPSTVLLVAWPSVMAVQVYFVEWYLEYSTSIHLKSLLIAIVQELWWSIWAPLPYLTVSAMIHSCEYSEHQLPICRQGRCEQDVYSPCSSYRKVGLPQLQLYSHHEASSSNLAIKP